MANPLGFAWHSLQIACSMVCVHCFKAAQCAPMCPAPGLPADGTEVPLMQRSAIGTQEEFEHTLDGGHWLPCHVQAPKHSKAAALPLPALMRPLFTVSGCCYHFLELAIQFLRLGACMELG